MDVNTKYVDGVGQAIVVEMKYGKPNQENLKKIEENRKKLVSINADLIINLQMNFTNKIYERNST